MSIETVSFFGSQALCQTASGYIDQSSAWQILSQQYPVRVKTALSAILRQKAGQRHLIQWQKANPLLAPFFNTRLYDKDAKKFVIGTATLYHPQVLSYLVFYVFGEEAGQKYQRQFLQAKSPFVSQEAWLARAYKQDNLFWVRALSPEDRPVKAAIRRLLATWSKPTWHALQDKDVGLVLLTHTSTKKPTEAQTAYLRYHDWQWSKIYACFCKVYQKGVWGEAKEMLTQGFSDYKPTGNERFFDPDKPCNLDEYQTFDPLHGLPEDPDYVPQIMDFSDWPDYCKEHGIDPNDQSKELNEPPFGEYLE